MSVRVLLVLLALKVVRAKATGEECRVCGERYMKGRKYNETGTPSCDRVPSEKCYQGEPYCNTLEISVMGTEGGVKYLQRSGICSDKRITCRDILPYTSVTPGSYTCRDDVDLAVTMETRISELLTLGRRDEGVVQEVVLDPGEEVWCGSCMETRYTMSEELWNLTDSRSRNDPPCDWSVQRLCPKGQHCASMELIMEGDGIRMEHRVSQCSPTPGHCDNQVIHTPDLFNLAVVSCKTGINMSHPNLTKERAIEKFKLRGSMSGKGRFTVFVKNKKGDGFPLNFMDKVSLQYCNQEVRKVNIEKDMKRIKITGRVLLNACEYVAFCTTLTLHGDYVEDCFW